MKKIKITRRYVAGYLHGEGSWIAPDFLSVSWVKRTHDNGADPEDMRGWPPEFFTADSLEEAVKKAEKSNIIL